MKSETRDIDEYISRYPPEVQDLLRAIRATVREIAPEAKEAISYGIPAFMLDGPVLYFAAFRNHVSVYPAPRANEEFREELARYEGGKGTLKLRLDQPLPLDLIARIVKFRLADNAARAAKRGNRSKPA